MQFHLVMAAGEIGVFPAAPFHLLITEIILLLAGSLRGNPVMSGRGRPTGVAPRTA